jgi:hypothetical protein
VIAKTNAERQKEWRDRQKTAAVGPEVRGVFAHPDDWPAIKALADKLQRKREREAKKAK